MILATIAYVFYLTTIPNLVTELKEAGIKAHDDLEEWGLNKIAFNFTKINERSLTHHIIEDEVHEEEEIHKIEKEQEKSETNIKEHYDEPQGHQENYDDTL